MHICNHIPIVKDSSVSFKNDRIRALGKFRCRRALGIMDQSLPRHPNSPMLQPKSTANSTQFYAISIALTAMCQIFTLYVELNRQKKKKKCSISRTTKWHHVSFGWHWLNTILRRQLHMKALFNSRHTYPHISDLQNLATTPMTSKVWCNLHHVLQQHPHEMFPASLLPVPVQIFARYCIHFNDTSNRLLYLPFHISHLLRENVPYPSPPRTEKWVVAELENQNYAKQFASVIWALNAQQQERSLEILQETPSITSFNHWTEVNKDSLHGETIIWEKYSPPLGPTGPLIGHPLDLQKRSNLWDLPEKQENK